LLARVVLALARAALALVAASRGLMWWPGWRWLRRRAG
jgi:hypothetical protein